MTSKAKSAQATPVYKYVPKDKDLPASQGMLHLVRNELKAEMRAGFKQVDAQFKEVDARFDRLESKVEQVLAEVSRIGIQVEEQNSRNRIVLEGLTSLWQRQDRVEVRMDDLEAMVRSIARART